MKRPKTSSNKMSWFNIAGVFLLAVALAVGATTSAQAATGSFDRDDYLPSLSDTNDFDRAFISVTDSSVTTSSTDTITVTVKAGANSVAFVLRETGNTTTVFTTTGSTQPVKTVVGSTTGYVEDFSGSHNYPALRSSIAGLGLYSFVTQQSGNAETSTDGKLNVSSGDTLALLYGGSTLDTAKIGFYGTNDNSITFTKGSTWGNSGSGTASSSDNPANVIVSITDPDENLNPKVKEVIGFKDGFSLGLQTGTGSSRVQIEALDQTTGTTLSVGGTSTVASQIMFVETGENTGIFTAQGRVYGSTTANLYAAFRGNVSVDLLRDGTTTGNLQNAGTILVANPGSSSTDSENPYLGGTITVGTTTTSAAGYVRLQLLEATTSGTLVLYNIGSGTAGAGAQMALAYTTDSALPGSSTNNAGGTQTDKVIATGTRTVKYFPGIATFSSNQAWSSAISETSTVLGSGNTSLGMLKLFDGNEYCLVLISEWAGTTTSVAYTDALTYGLASNAIASNGTVSVTLGDFVLFGPRSGDTIKVSYLDELTSGGSVGTVTSATTFGVSGEAGTLSVDKTTADINDFMVVTVVDGNLNSSASQKETVIGGTSLYSGTSTTSSGTATSRGDRLTVAAYSRTGISGVGSNTVGISHPDGSRVGTQTVRISSTDNSLVWVVPTSLTYSGFGAPTANGTSSFGLGTQSTSTIPLVKGASSTADSFLSSATTLSFVATTDAADNTLEVSPDGTHWVAVPIVETGVNSSTFIGTVGFDCTGARITTSTTVTAATTFSDFTGTSTISFSSEGGNTTLGSSIGTGSVVRISDGTFSEVKEVTGVSGSVLTVEKLSNSGFYTPWKTFVQVVGNDLDNNRLDTVSGSSVFRIGGFYGATYRFRYNDASGASNAYAGGDTLAVTTSNAAFSTYTGDLSVSPSGTVGLNSQIEVVLVDHDLNVSVSTENTTFSNQTTTFLNLNEVGLGNPIGTSSANTIFRNGSIAKQILASRATSVTSTSFADASNTVTVTLKETGANSGTFKGTLKLSSGSSTAGNENPPTLKVSNGDTITVFYNDSPSATSENNLSSYTTVSMTGKGGLGTLSLSKSEAFLSGDSVVITLSDNDKNTTNSLDSATVSYKSSSETSSTSMSLTETGANSGTFKGTIRTSTSTSSSTTPPTVRAVANGTVTVTYADDSPAADVTASFSTKNYGATLAFGADSVAIGSSIGVSLYDPETNSSISQADLVNVNVKSTTDSSGTTLRLTETGNDTGSFLGTIAASSDSSLLNTRIKTAVGDTITATFTDSVDASAGISTVTDTASVTAAVATPTPAVSPSPGASPTATPVTSPTATPVVSPTLPPTLPPITPVVSPTLPPTLPPFTPPPITPTPTTSPTPAPCEDAEAISVSPSKLTLKKKKSGTVTVTVTCGDGLAVEGETVTVTLTSASKKRVSVTPTSTSTDASGQATFTITAKKKTGNARVTFKAGSVKKSITVKVK